MVPTFKQHLIDQDAALERRRKQVQRERELRARTEAKVAVGIRKTRNTKPDSVTWCPDLYPSKN